MNQRESDLRAALEATQWGSCDGCGSHEHCPVCGASRVARFVDEGEDVELLTEVIGEHAPDCIVGKALKQ